MYKLLDIVYPVILILSFGLIPILAMYYKKHKFMIMWLSLGAMLDIFSYQKFFNISSFKIAGILFIFWSIFNIREIFKTVIGKLICLYSCYLILSFIFFVLISPWPVENIETLSTMGLTFWKGARQLVTQLGEMGIIAYLGHLFKDEDLVNFSIKALFTACVVAAIGVILERFLVFDFFNFVTHGRALLLETRFRGFNYEPRAAAQTIVYGILLAMIYQSLNIYVRVLASVTLLIALVFAVSTTGWILLVSGVFISFILIIFFAVLKKISWNRSYYISCAAFIIFGFLLLFVGASYLGLEKQQNAIKENYKARSYVINDKSLLNKFEVFDAAALNVYVHNPKYLFFGVGTGQMSFLSRNYVIARDAPIWNNLATIEWLPTTGFVLLLANGGVVLLLIFVSMCMVSFYNVISVKELINRRYLQDIVILTFVILTLYFLQVRFIYPFALAWGLSSEYRNKGL